MFTSRFASPNALQQYHQMLAMSAASGYPNVSMYAPQQRPRINGLTTPFDAPYFGPQPQMPMGRGNYLSSPRPIQRTWQSFPQLSPQQFGQGPVMQVRRSARPAGYGSLLSQLPFRTPLVTR